MIPLLFKNARIFDGANAECAEGIYVRVSDGLIQEVSPKSITAKDARLIDVGGRTLMPGLIDAHMHAYCSDVSMQKVEAMGEPYRTARGPSRAPARLVTPRSIGTPISATSKPPKSEAAPHSGR